MLLIKYRFYQVIGLLIGTFHAMTLGLFYKPKEGYVRNPLHKIPNYPCGCNSGKKTKKCHGSVRYVTEEDAKAVNDFIKRVKDYERGIDEKNSVHG